MAYEQQRRKPNAALSVSLANHISILHATRCPCMPWINCTCKRIAGPLPSYLECKIQRIHMLFSCNGHASWRGEPTMRNGRALQRSTSDCIHNETCTGRKIVEISTAPSSVSSSTSSNPGIWQAITGSRSAIDWHGLSVSRRLPASPAKQHRRQESVD